MKGIFVVILTGVALFAAGCITDSSSSNSKKDPATTISQLSMGGGVFYFKQEGYAIAQFGAFYGTDPYENAKVFVNGLELQNNMGIFSNNQPLPSALIDNGKPVHIAVYALGDSVVHNIALPESPVFLSPAADAMLAVGDTLKVAITYPRNHQFISMSLSNQDGVALGMETAEKELAVTIPGAKIINTGQSTITALSSNASGPIPNNVDLNNQYTVFLVSSVASRNVNFVKK